MFPWTHLLDLSDFAVYFFQKNQFYTLYYWALGSNWALKKNFLSAKINASEILSFMHLGLWRCLQMLIQHGRKKQEIHMVYGNKREKYYELARIQIIQSKHAAISSFLSQTCSLHFSFLNTELLRLLHYHTHSQEPRRTVLHQNRTLLCLLYRWLNNSWLVSRQSTLSDSYKNLLHQLLVDSIVLKSFRFDSFRSICLVFMLELNSN